MSLHRVDANTEDVIHLTCQAEIMRLKMENDRYRRAMENIANPKPSIECPIYYAEADNMQRIAREALEVGGE